MAVLRAVNISRKYEGSYALKETSLTLEGGEAFGLIGPTGSGKTTLIRLLDLLVPTSSGTIHFDDIDVTRDPKARLEARRRMSYVQQKPVIFTMSVFDNVASGLRWRHMRGEEIKRRVNSALELVGMAAFRKRNAKTLSGGETQRVAIARALVTLPEILFLDEPTSNLDPISTEKIERVIRDILREGKVTVVIATHDLSLGQQIAHRMAVLLNGEMMQVGSPEEIFSSPGNQKVAEFVGIENILPGKILRKQEKMLMIEIGNRQIQVVSRPVESDSVYVLIRPEDIIFSCSQEMTGTGNLFPGTVTGLNPMGPLVRIEVNCGFPLRGLLLRGAANRLEVKAGEEIFVGFSAEAPHLLPRAD